MDTFSASTAEDVSNETSSNDPAQHDGTQTPDNILNPLLHECYDAVANHEQANEKNEQALYDSLSKILELQQTDDRLGTGFLETIYKERKILNTKKTKGFTRIVKLFYGKNKDKSAISRYAGVLRFASANGATHEEFAELVRSEGGIVECYRKDRDRHGKTASTPDANAIVEAAGVEVAVPEEAAVLKTAGYTVEQSGNEIRLSHEQPLTFEPLGDKLALTPKNVVDLLQQGPCCLLFELHGIEPFIVAVIKSKPVESVMHELDASSDEAAA